MQNRIDRSSFVKTLWHCVTILLGNSKGPIELGNTNICAEVKLCLLLFILAVEILCRETEVFTRVRLRHFNYDFGKFDFVSVDPKPMLFLFYLFS